MPKPAHCIQQVLIAVIKSLDRIIGAEICDLYISSKNGIFTFGHIPYPIRVESVRRHDRNSDGMEWMLEYLSKRGNDMVNVSENMLYNQKRVVVKE